MIICYGKHDPGPCPVDDAPHTTCVSPDYVPGSSARIVVAAVQRPRVLDQALIPAPQPAAVAAPPVDPETFTTATYTRKDHGRAARARRAHARD